METGENEHLQPSKAQTCPREVRTIYRVFEKRTFNFYARKYLHHNFTISDTFTNIRTTDSERQTSNQTSLPKMVGRVPG